MLDDPVISLSKVSKVFKRYHHPIVRLKELLLPGKSKAEEFWALKDIDLEVCKGETVGIIGRNGSGKSTLLQIIAGTLQPTSGEVQVNGRVSALLELGSGFNPEFTGRQNVFFNGRILGLAKEEIEERFDDIAAFADIGQFIEQPVKTYSSGMFVRLAFAVAAHVEPEVLIIDEALAVGDVVFQHKCMRKVKSMMDGGVATLLVSHDPTSIRSLCNRAYMLEQGKTYTSGKPDDVFIEYKKLTTQIELDQLNRSKQKEMPTLLNDNLNINGIDDLGLCQTSRRGSGKAKITSIQLFHEDGSLAILSPSFKFNEEINIVINVTTLSPLEDFIFGFFICDKYGNEIIGSNTREEGKFTGSLEDRSEIKIGFTVKLPLKPGAYSLTVAGAEDYMSPTCDWIDNVLVFKIIPPENGKQIPALVSLPMTVHLDVFKASNAYGILSN